jgi:hypothetical protein
MWVGLDDEGAGVVLELNAVNECQEVEQEIRCLACCSLDDRSA